jgi:hypothetical protein
LAAAGAAARRLLALLLAGTYAFDAWQTLSFGRWHKPGAAIFPIALAALLALSAISVLLKARRCCRILCRRPLRCLMARTCAGCFRACAFAIYFVTMPFSAT